MTQARCCEEHARITRTTYFSATACRETETYCYKAQLREALEERDRWFLRWDEEQERANAAIERAEAADRLLARVVSFARGPVSGMDVTNYEVYTDAGRQLIDDIEAFTPAEAQERKGSGI